MNPLISYKLYNSLNCTLEGWVPLAVVGGAFSSFFHILLPILHIININIYQSPDPGWGKGGWPHQELPKPVLFNTNEYRQKSR